MAEKEKKKDEGGKFTSNKKGKLDSLAGNESISRALNVATRVALIAVAVIMMWKFFTSGSKAEAPPATKPAVAEKKTSATDFPPIIVNLAGWAEWVEINPKALPNHSKCYFEGPDEARIKWSSERESSLHEISSHEREVGRPVAFLGEAGTKVVIHCKRKY